MDKTETVSPSPLKLLGDRVSGRVERSFERVQCDLLGVIRECDGLLVEVDLHILHARLIAERAAYGLDAMLAGDIGDGKRDGL